MTLAAQPPDVVSDQHGENPVTPIRLPYLDGIRGLAALYVVLFHTWNEIDWKTGGLPVWLHSVTCWMSQGRIAVAVFIVLSGYCLMLPVVTRGSGFLNGGVADYIRRRARRILPPYYAATAFSLLIIACLPDSIWRYRGWWDSVSPAWTPGVLVSHLFLLHNLRAEWAFKIDPPMWSVATEWQIYFFFPALLLPVWRRFGAAALLASTLCLGLTPMFFLRSYEWAAPWFLHLFAIGMVAASVGFSHSAGRTRMRADFSWGLAAAMLFCLFVFVNTFSERIPFLASDWKHTLIMDLLVGLATACLLIHCSNLEKRRLNRNPVVLRCFSHRISQFLGRCSYSLYLTHAWAVIGLHLLLVTNKVGAVAAAAVMLLLTPILALLTAYPFYCAFERPSIRRVVK